MRSKGMMVSCRCCLVQQERSALLLLSCWRAFVVQHCLGIWLKKRSKFKLLVLVRVLACPRGLHSLISRGELRHHLDMVKTPLAAVPDWQVDVLSTIHIKDWGCRCPAYRATTTVGQQLQRQCSSDDSSADAQLKTPRHFPHPRLKVIGEDRMSLFECTRLQCRGLAEVAPQPGHLPAQAC